MVENKLKISGLDTDSWTRVRTDATRPVAGYVVTAFESRFYQREEDGALYSLGRFFLNGEEVLRAWGLYDAEHCSHHAVPDSDKVFRTAFDGCPNVRVHAKTGADAELRITIGSTVITHNVIATPMSTTSVSKQFTKKIKTFAPLIAMVILVAVLSLITQSAYGWSVHTLMTDVMAFYFIVFGVLKVLNIQQFVKSYRAYDFLAKHVPGYAYAYPIIEIVLGILFLGSYYLTVASWITLLLMLQKAESVYRKVRAGSVTTCACLGGFFAVPITWVTFVEDMFMAVMALGMILWM